MKDDIIWEGFCSFEDFSGPEHWKVILFKNGICKVIRLFHGKEEQNFKLYTGDIVAAFAKYCLFCVEHEEEEENASSK